MWRAATRFKFVIILCFVAMAIFADASFAFAQGDPALPVAQAAGAARMNPYQFILGTVNFFLIAFFVYYVLMLRPQQLKQDEHARFLKDLKNGEEVTTTGGLIGKVTAMSPEFITLDVGSGTKLRFKPEHVFSAKAKQVVEKPVKNPPKELAAK